MGGVMGHEIGGHCGLKIRAALSIFQGNLVGGPRLYILTPKRAQPLNQYLRVSRQILEN